MTNFTFQDDTLDEFRWSTIETEFSDDGTILNRTTVYDDAVKRFENFAAGVLRYQRLEDVDADGGPSDVKPWESIHTLCDDNGQRAESFQRNDDGTGLRKQFEAGQLRQVTQTDFGENGTGSDTKSWERIETTFNSNGNRDYRFELYDDGVRVEKFYEDGVIRHEERLDVGEYGAPSDARKWEAILIEYDGDGKISARFDLQDNGLETLRQYENGVIRYMEQLDVDEYGNSTDTAKWDRIETEYHIDGVIASKSEYRDDGTVLSREYSEGQLVFAEHLDRDQMGQMSSTKAWDSIRTFYDGAKVQWRETTFDNGDVTAIEFNDGTRLIKLDYDGNSSHAWLLRETVYDEAGQVTAVNTYNSYEDVPPEYRWFDAAG